MPLKKEQKEKIIGDLKDKLSRQKSLVFVDFSGLKVKDFSDLRKKMKSVGAEIKAAKKTLAGIVFKGLSIEAPLKDLKGELALVIGYEDEISPVKTVSQFSKENQNLKILGGFFEGNFLDSKEIIAFGCLPSKNELLAKLIYSMSSPISNFVNVLEGNIKGLLYVLTKVKT